MENKIPFPQADDFEKVIKLINLENIEKYNDKIALSMILGDIADRQVQYYLSACMYLGILDEKKNLTPKGVSIRKLNYAGQVVELSRIIISDEIFGEVYFMQKYLEVKLNREDVIGIMKKKISFNSEELYKRRAQTVIKWIEWINNVMNDKDV